MPPSKYMYAAELFEVVYTQIHSLINCQEGKQFQDEVLSGFCDILHLHGHGTNSFVNYC